MVSEADILDASILIVDDQESNVRLLEEILRQTGYRRVTSIMSPQVVCGLHRANHYDLILLDLPMPGMDGVQVMACLEEIETTGYAPSLVITAQPGQKQRALASGARGFLAKPFDLIELKTRIHNMLEVRLLYKRLADQNASLASLALYDALTGLPNGPLLMDRLSLAIVHARRNQRTMAVMFLDLDGFKQINDTRGHDVGDMLLRLLADRLVATVRQEDTVARLGGDEFVIALYEAIDIEQVAKQASKNDFRISAYADL